MTEVASNSKGKAELRQLAIKSLANQLKPLVKTLKEIGIERSSTEDMGVHTLFGIIKTYQDYFKVLNTIDSFDTGNGRSRDTQKRGVMLDVYMSMWLKNPDKLPPKQSPFKDEVQKHIRTTRITNKKGEIISISEDSCYDFLREMKKFASSPLPLIMKNHLLDV
jgi:hypothetical protein